MAKIDINKKIQELEGSISANEIIFNQINLSKPNNYLFKKFIGTFTSLLFIVLPIYLLFIFVVGSLTFILLIEFVSIILLFSFIALSIEPFYMFPYLRDSLNLTNYEKLLSKKEKLMI